MGCGCKKKPINNTQKRVTSVKRATTNKRPVGRRIIKRPAVLV